MPWAYLTSFTGWFLIYKWINICMHCILKFCKNTVTIKIDVCINITSTYSFITLNKRLQMCRIVFSSLLQSTPSNISPMASYRSSTFSKSPEHSFSTSGKDTQNLFTHLNSPSFAIQPVTEILLFVRWIVKSINTSKTFS